MVRLVRLSGDRVKRDEKARIELHCMSVSLKRGSKLLNSS